MIAPLPLRGRPRVDEVHEPTHAVLRPATQRILIQYWAPLPLHVLGILIVGATALCGINATGAEDVLTLATTTSTDNSGLLAHIHPHFEKKAGVRVKVIAKGTGASLQLARDGNVDVVLVHARQKEDEFVAEGYGVMRRDVMYNDFVIIGPKADPAGIGDTRNATDALKRLAASGQAFISRGDGSGTHIKEQQLWRSTGLPLRTKNTSLFAGGKRKEVRSLEPVGRWYLSIGQGMGKTIMVTSEKQAYTLADRGTYYAFALPRPPRTDLVILSEGDESLYNPYGVIAVNPAKHPHVNFAMAREYIHWITSPEVQQMIGEYAVGGKVLFHPNAAPAKKR